MTSLIAEGVALETRLEPTDLRVEAGTLVALIGPNGGGKTSLLRALARVEGAKGRVCIDGEDLDQLSEARRRQLLAFLPASRDIGWPIAARDVIALGLARQDPPRVDELIDQFELHAFAHRPVDQLSTGERARVLIARALAARPRLLLLDEPLSNLDPYWVLRFLDVLRSCADDGQMLVVALHDLTLIHRFDRALLVSDGRLQINEAPPDLMASERFEEIFRVQRLASGDLSIRREDRRSSR